MELTHKQPTIVYKYRDWCNPYHKAILKNNTLYLASPKDFNDPFDCRINSNFSLLDTKEEEEYIKNLAISGFEASEKQGKDFRIVLREFEDRFKDKVAFQKFADSLLYNHQDESYAIFSCSKEWDNIALWAYYANNHKGFCVGFWTQQMMDYGLFGKLGEVVYQSEYPKIKPRVAKKDEQLMINSFIETHTKAEVWGNEHEFRFMTNYFPKVLSEKDRQVKINDSFFAEIILGINISSSDKQELIEICRVKKIPVFQAIKEDFMFRIKKVEVI